MAETLSFENVPGKWHCGGDYPSVRVTRVKRSAGDTVAFLYGCNVNVDMDGWAEAYGPPEKPGQENLQNAWNTKKGWFGVYSMTQEEVDAVKKNYKMTVLIDKRDEMKKMTRGAYRYPVIQSKANGDPFPGFYVSVTSRPKGPSYLQKSHVDASRVPFGALSGGFKASTGLELGDVGVAIRTDKLRQSAFYYADMGGKGSTGVGECSLKVNTNLGGTRHYNDFLNGYIVFPSSKTGGNTEDQVKIKVREQLAILSSATNAQDIAYLLGFYAEAGKTKAPLPLFEAFKAKNSGSMVPLSFPKNYRTIVMGLKAVGLDIPLHEVGDFNLDPRIPAMA